MNPSDYWVKSDPASPYYYYYQVVPQNQNPNYVYFDPASQQQPQQKQQQQNCANSQQQQHFINNQQQQPNKNRPVLRRQQTVIGLRNSQKLIPPPPPPRRPQASDKVSQSRGLPRTNSFSNSSTSGVAPLQVRSTQSSHQNVYQSPFSPPYQNKTTDRPVSSPCYQSSPNQRPLPMVNYQVIDRSQVGSVTYHSQSSISPIVYRDSNYGPVYGSVGHAGYLSEGADMMQMGSAPATAAAMMGCKMPGPGGTRHHLQPMIPSLGSCNQEQRVFKDGISAIKDCLQRSDIKLAESDRLVD